MAKVLDGQMRGQHKVLNGFILAQNQKNYMHIGAPHEAGINYSEPQRHKTRTPALIQQDLTSPPFYK